MDDDQADWSFFSQAPKVIVEAWQACALSLDIDPDSIRRERYGKMVVWRREEYDSMVESKKFPSKDIKEEFDKRLRLLIATIDAREFFTLPPILNLRAPNRQPVLLAEFAAWARSCGLKIPTQLEALAKTAAPIKAEQEPAHSEADTSENDLALLFDPVSPTQLEKMFPSDGKWKAWASRALESGLSNAREGRNRYNPYTAAEWWLARHPQEGWDWARCNRTLANNLPSRSRGNEHLLTGEPD